MAARRPSEPPMLCSIWADGCPAAVGWLLSRRQPTANQILLAVLGSHVISTLGSHLIWDLKQPRLKREFWLL